MRGTGERDGGATNQTRLCLVLMHPPQGSGTVSSRALHEPLLAYLRVCSQAQYGWVRGLWLTVTQYARAPAPPYNMVRLSVCWRQPSNMGLSCKIPMSSL
jgi:hypothetical protein